MNANFEAAKARAIQKLEPRPGVLRTGMDVATLAQVRQIATRAEMNAILEGANIPGEPFKKPAATKIKNELNNNALGGHRKTRRSRRRNTRRRH